MSTHVATHVVRIGLEIVGLVALGYWGAATRRGRRSRILLGISVPLVAVVVWGVFGTAGAPIPASPTVRVMLRFTFFAVVVSALLSTSHALIGAGVGLVYLVNSVALAMWGS
jgi:hypothetical protein